MMPRLVIEARRRVNRLRDPIDHHVGQQLILGEAALDVAAAIAPGAELLDDPSGKTGRRIVEAVGERLRLGALNPLVAGFIAPEALQVGQKYLLRGTELGVASALGCADRDHVNVDSIEI